MEERKGFESRKKRRVGEGRWTDVPIAERYLRTEHNNGRDTQLRAGLWRGLSPKKLNSAANVREYSRFEEHFEFENSFKLF